MLIQASVATCYGLLLYFGTEPIVRITSLVTLVCLGILHHVINAHAEKHGYSYTFVKRFTSSIVAIFLSSTALYALLFDPNFEFGDGTQSLRTNATLIAITIEITVICFDLFHSAPEQTKILMYLVHHYTGLFLWEIFLFYNVGLTAALITQVQELANPFWYLHWSLMTIDGFMDPKWRTIFKVNFWICMTLYIGVRLLVSTPLMFLILYRSFSAWSWPFITLMTFLTLLSVYINPSNTNKLWRSYKNAMKKLNDSKPKRSE